MFIFTSITSVNKKNTYVHKIALPQCSLLRWRESQDELSGRQVTNRALMTAYTVMFWCQRNYLTLHYPKK